MTARVRPDLVDGLIEVYCQWRSQCWDVRSAYERFTAATADDRAVAYAAYRAALDREESAADAYAEQIARVESLATTNSRRPAMRS